VKQQRQTNIVPRAALLGAAGLVGAALLSATAARVLGVEPLQTPTAAPQLSRELRFEDRGGAVVVLDAAGATVDILPPGTNGFIRGLMRGLARERRASEIGPERAFRLTRWADGRLSIEDPATGRWIDLGAFGPTNAGAFARLLDVRGESR